MCDFGTRTLNIQTDGEEPQPLTLKLFLDPEDNYLDGEARPIRRARGRVKIISSKINFAIK